jgi:peptidoglycan/LPS O-acetylase OafA/YrhL
MEHRYYDALDGLRAVCIILTILCHTGAPGFINGALGVDVFFALSGYLITTLLVRENIQFGDVCLTCFYVRRFFRIVPLYYLTIALYGIAMYLASVAHHDYAIWLTYLKALPWLISFMSEFRPPNEVFGHAWTLGIEEEYYIVWPIFFMAIAKFGGRSKLVPIIVSFVFMLTLGELSLRGYGGLIAGSGLALAVEPDKSSARRLIVDRSIHIFALSILVGYISCTLLNDTRFNLLVSIPSAFFISALIHGSDNVYRRVLSITPVRQIGQLTYGIYLIHLLVLHIIEELLKFLRIDLHNLHWTISFLLVYGGSIAAALILRTFVEDPFIKVGKRFSDLLRDKAHGGAMK